MKFKKVVSAVLVSALAVSMMAGCGSKSGKLRFKIRCI